MKFWGSQAFKLGWIGWVSPVALRLSTNSEGYAGGGFRWSWYGCFFGTQLPLEPPKKDWTLWRFMVILNYFLKKWDAYPSFKTWSGNAWDDIWGNLEQWGFGGDTSSQWQGRNRGQKLCWLESKMLPGIETQHFPTISESGNFHRTRSRPQTPASLSTNASIYMYK